MTYFVFLDIDGTLVDYDCHLPASAVAAIREARQNGHRIYICSGRSRAEIYPELWAIGLDGYIGANGAYIEEKDKVLFHRHFSREDTAAIVRWLNAHRLAFYLESNSGLYASPDFFVKASAIYGDAPDRENMLRRMFPHMIEGAALEHDDINKISFYINGQTHYLNEAAQFFPQTTVGSWGANRHEAQFGDFGQKNISKADAVARVLAAHRHERARSIAFGDADMDAPMFAACGIGVAMGNGKESLKAIADFVTRDVNDDGLAHAFAHFGLISL